MLAPLQRLLIGLQAVAHHVQQLSHHAMAGLVALRVELFSQFLAGTQGATFEQVVALGPGDTVDFVVGRGADNSSFASGLKLSANLHHADH